MALTGLWLRLPLIVRTVVIGSFVTGVGTAPQAILTNLNFMYAPAIPWAVPAVAVFLWAYWSYLNGGGWPRSNAEWRRRSLRACKVPGRLWRWAIAAGGLAWISLLALRLFSDRYLNLPRDPFPDVSSFPLVTILAFMLMASIVAGVVEEAGLRGYMQGPLEQRYGPLAAILMTGVAFWFAHALNFARAPWLFLAYMPFYLGASAIFGALAYFTRSILPAVALHASANILGFGLIWWGATSPETFLGIGDRRDLYLWTTGLTGLVLAPPALWAFRQLALAAHKVRLRSA
jgi:membrane protease YdiL (CAAX protease family)